MTTNPNVIITNIIQADPVPNTIITVTEKQAELLGLLITPQPSETIPVINLNTTPLNGRVDNCSNGQNGRKVVYRVLNPEDLQLVAPVSSNKTLKRGRPKKVHSLENDDEFLAEVAKESLETPLKAFRTRSGRMTKPPRHIQQDSNLLTDEKQTPDPVVDTKEPEKLDPPKLPTHKRNISSQYRCATCKKAYLAKSRMVRHLQLNPDHIGPPVLKKKSTSLWSSLIDRAHSAPKGQQTKKLCDEFVDLLRKARVVLPKLLKPSTNDTIGYEIDQYTARALGIAEGKYELAESDLLIAFDENDTQQIGFEVPADQNNSLMNLLDTGQVTFDSNSSITEEFMNVDQLVNERLKTFTGPELSPPNTAQNLSLDLSLDMFSYHTS